MMMHDEINHQELMIYHVASGLIRYTHDRFDKKEAGFRSVRPPAYKIHIKEDM